MTERHDLVDRLDALLPQTQCTRCGYPTCRDYARAIAAGEAAINRCPPGGEDGIAAMAALLGITAPPLDPDFGVAAPPTLAVIDEDVCIGCTKCIQACPVDAIVGGPKHMHTVLADLCTGCALCVPACPVDCIHMDNVSGSRTGWAAWSAEQAQAARKRYEFTSWRRRQDKGKSRISSESSSTAPDGAPALPPAAPGGEAAEAERKRRLIEAALARARQQRPPR